MSGRNLMWGGFRSHPDAVVKDEPALELLGASLMAAGLAAGSMLRVPRYVSAGATERTHRHIKKRGKRIRVPLTNAERRKDYVGDEERIVAVLTGHAAGLSATDIGHAIGIKVLPPGWLYRLLNRMVQSGRLVKRDLHIKPGLTFAAKRGSDRVFVLVSSEAHT